MTTKQAPSRLWARVETRYQRPMRDILLTLHMKYGTWNAMATALGIQPPTLRDWWMRASLPEFGKQDDGTVTIMVCGEVS